MYGLKPRFGKQLIKGHPLAPNFLCLPLSEGSGNTAFDLSKGNDGTLNNLTWVGGRYGTALDFNGSSSYMQAGAFDPSTTDFTFYVRVRVDVIASSAHAVLSQQNGTGTGRSILSFEATTGNLSTFLGGGVKYSGYAASVGEWLDIALIHDSSASTLTWVVNGVEKNTNTSVVMDSATGDFIFGASKILSGYFDGLMDVAYAYTKAHPVSQAKQLSLNPYAMFEPAFNPAFFVPVVAGGVGQLVNRGLVNSGLIGGRLVA